MTGESKPEDDGIFPGIPLENAGIIGRYIKKRLSGFKSEINELGDRLSEVESAQDGIVREQKALRSEVKTYVEEARSAKSGYDDVDGRIGSIKQNYDGINHRITDMNSRIGEIGGHAEAAKSKANSVENSTSEIRREIGYLKRGLLKRQPPGYIKRFFLGLIGIEYIGDRIDS